MPDDDKLFVYTKRGMNVQITPRNRRGVLALLAWILAFMPMTVAYVMVVDGAGTWTLITATVALLLALGGWLFLMVRWMKPRSEIIDVDALLEVKREQERKKRRGRN